MLIKYKAVRDAIYRQKKNVSQKDVNLLESVRMWLAQIEEEGGKSLFKTGPDGAFTITWATQFQLCVSKLLCTLPRVPLRLC